MAGQVPDSGYKKDIVGPGSGGGGGASPATTAPPEVQAASVLGVSLLYARQDHTHQSPTVYLPSGAGISTNILGNRSANNAPTDLASIGIVNFGSKTAGASTGVSGAYCSLLGGDRNSLTSGYGFLGGGRNNTVTANYAVLVGGNNNSILSTNTDSTDSFIGAGDSNVIDDSIHAFIGGGSGNTNSGSYGAIVGGENNSLAISGAAPTRSFIGAGTTNVISGQTSCAIVSGGGNSINDSGGNAESSFIGAGNLNSIISGVCSFIGAGTDNLNQCDYSMLGAGSSNTISSTDAVATNCFLGSGTLNEIGGGNNVFLGAGSGCSASGDNVFIGGGTGLSVSPGTGSSEESGICSGSTNQVTSCINSFIGGGVSNAITSSVGTKESNFIGGGAGNQVAASSWGSVVGGFVNIVSGGFDYATIGGGIRNAVTATSGTIPGGERGSCYITGSFVHASGTLSATGEQQYTHVVISGQTPGLTVNESVVLTPRTALGSNVFATIANRAYTVILEVTMARNNLSDARSFLVHALVVTDALNAVTVVQQSILSQLGSPATALYTVNVSAGAAPSRIIVTAATGAGNTHKVIVSCTARMTETANNYP